MPYRKNQIEKLAWLWIETTEPEKITREHIFTAYILHPPHSKKTACKKNCQNQPLCLHALGESRWLSQSRAAGCGGDADSSAEDDQLQLRAAGWPAGLTNLGATCYVNCLLQLWFHNRALRNILLLWNPYFDAEERYNATLGTEIYQPCTPVGHLQLIFALMLKSRLKTVETAPLVAALRLDISYQQDAQEFSQLLSTLVETSLCQQQQQQKQEQQEVKVKVEQGVESTESVNSLPNTLNRGQYEYVTTCSCCQRASVSSAPFHELQLQLHSSQQLQLCIEQFLAGERLEGSNQYYCCFCSCKRDATRSIRLRTLPSILNLQLMRFVFDRESSTKKKLTSRLVFPEVLEMSEFGDFPSTVCTSYRLQAVLSHSGRSAHSGHYIAQIYSDEAQCWYKFNDEEVHKVKALKLNNEDDLDATGRKSQSNRQPRCQKGYHSSINAYMLVYVSQSHLADQKAYSDPLTNEHVLVNTPTNENLSPNISTNQKAYSDKLTNENMTANKLANGNTPQDVSTNETALSSDMDKQIISKHEPTNDRTAVEASTNQDHPNCEATNQKTGEETLPDHLEIVVQRINTDLDQRLITIKNEKEVAEFEHFRRKQEVTSIYSHMACDTPLIEDFCLLPSAWLTRWLAGESPGQIDTGDLYCSHSKLDPCNATRLKCITRKAADMLLERFGGNVLDSSALCRECVEARCRLLRYKYLLDESVRRVTSLLKLNDAAEMSRNIAEKRKNDAPATKYWVGKESLRNWRQMALDASPYQQLANQQTAELSLHSAGDVAPSSPADLPPTDTVSNVNTTAASAVNHHDNNINNNNTEDEANDDIGCDLLRFNEDIVCPHGSLCADGATRRLVSDEVWQVLLQYFPDASVLTENSEPCAVCEEDRSQNQQLRQVQREVAIEQRTTLSALYNYRDRPPTDVNAIYRAVSRHSYEEWRRFVRMPCRTSASFMASGDLLCHHGNLLYDPAISADSDRLVLLYDWEWEVVKRSGHDGVNVTVTCSSDSPPITTPGLCVECSTLRRDAERKQQLTYTHARLYIRKVACIDTELVREMSIKRARLDEDQCNTSIQSNPSESSPVVSSIRRSNRRLRQSTAVEKSITVDSANTLLQVKIKLMKLFKVATYDQRLVLPDGTELDDNQQSLAQLGITPQSTIFLQADEEPTCTGDVSSEDISAAAIPELGFSGTCLSGS